MELICRGKTDPEIAQILGLGEGTVKQHLRMCYIKLDATSRTLAAVKYIDPERFKR